LKSPAIYGNNECYSLEYEARRSEKSSKAPSEIELEPKQRWGYRTYV
jgi:hypothetical protein